MARKSAAHKKLAEELSALIPQLDEEGLSFLVRQAQIHLHNMEVERINAELAKAEAAANLRAAKADAQRKSSAKSSAKTAGKNAAKGGAKKAAFSIKHSANAGCYHVRYQGEWKLFTEAEMLAVVRIAKSRQPVADVQRQCFAWLKRERSDILVEFGISSPDSETLKDFINFLKKTFAIRKSKA